MTLKIKGDYSIWMVKLVRLQQLIFNVANSNAINIKRVDYNFNSMRIEEENIKYTTIHSINSIIETDPRKWINKNTFINVSTIKGVLTLAYYILSNFTYINIPDRKYIHTNIKDNGNNVIFVLPIFTLSYVTSLIEYLQSLDLTPTINTPIPYINVIPNLKEIFKLKDEINNLLPKIDRYNFTISPIYRKLLEYNKELEISDDDYEALEDIIDFINYNGAYVTDHKGKSELLSIFKIVYNILKQNI